MEVAAVEVAADANQRVLGSRDGIGGLRERVPEALGGEVGQKREREEVVDLLVGEGIDDLLCEEGVELRRLAARRRRSAGKPGQGDEGGLALCLRLDLGDLRSREPGEDLGSLDVCQAKLLGAELVDVSVEDRSRRHPRGSNARGETQP